MEIKKLSRSKRLLAGLAAVGASCGLLCTTGGGRLRPAVFLIMPALTARCGRHQPERVMMLIVFPPWKLIYKSISRQMQKKLIRLLWQNHQEVAVLLPTPWEWGYISILRQAARL